MSCFCQIKNKFKITSLSGCNSWITLNFFNLIFFSKETNSLIFTTSFSNHKISTLDALLLFQQYVWNFFETMLQDWAWGKGFSKMASFRKNDFFAIFFFPENWFWTKWFSTGKINLTKFFSFFRLLELISTVRFSSGKIDF